MTDRVTDSKQAALDALDRISLLIQKYCGFRVWADEASSDMTEIQEALEAKPEGEREAAAISLLAKWHIFAIDGFPYDAEKRITLLFQTGNFFRDLKGKNPIQSADEYKSRPAPEGSAVIVSRDTHNVHDIRIEAQIPEGFCKDGDGWRPIESAPEVPGKYFFCRLAWGPEQDKSTGDGFRFEGRWYAAGNFHAPNKAYNERQNIIKELEVTPTHWQPLPQPPKQEG